ncbi:MAG: hypothetical protein Q8N53_18610 [Longimicrobiales bacterium]|nr:hypothetical protein [Longimicrobiales bacterium]
MTDPRDEEQSEDPGVPEALPRTLVHARGRLGAERVDRLWIFPPIRRGRRERGLVAASLFLEGEDRRRIVTVAYTAERTGRSLTVDHAFHEEGDAPPELLARVMEGVVRRAGEGYGDPRDVEIGGDPLRFEALVDEFDPTLLAGEPT